ncbi:MAG: helix-hairpin-helix domain-containing protein [Planctomycetota bacterium]|nr:helix-hairpin-helix domain-containing protein [Planctomycetota bacterium]
MDALALLCTLHADGPSTLVRLRSANCATLDEVIASDVDALAMLLRSSRLAAGRFQKEARQLLDRLVIVPVGASLEDAASAATEVRTGAERRRTPARTASAAAANHTDTQKVPVKSVPSAPSMIDRVLSAWRDADAMETVAPLAPTSAATIAIAAIDGMDAETALALAHAGVRDIKALAAADPLTLSRATNLSYSKLTRLRALARRAAPLTATLQEPPIARTQSAAVPSASAEQRLSPSERPHIPAEPVVRFDRDFVLEPIPSAEGVGGPFA